ncbi:uncharacterized protein [Macrobrachium rosenbergii]|uniref:uncharacterized protein n=1 Tax=Macrobrachium rosenbergii TaxID=79674 RepID=UPI0034D544F7
MTELVSQMLEAQAELERTEIEARYEQEEIDAKKRLEEIRLEEIRNRKRTEEKALAAKTKLEELSIEYETRSEAGDAPLNPNSTLFVPKRPSPDVSTYDSILKALDSTLASQQELSRRALLPPINLEVFDGDMTKFSMFRNAFLWVVESNSDDPARRLTHLHNSLRGPPKNLIEMCLHMPPSEGYEEGGFLCHKYEDDDDLTEAYLKRLFA